MVVKWITRLLIITGLFIVSYSSYKIWYGNTQVSHTLIEAKEIVREERNVIEESRLPLIQQDIKGDFDSTNIFGILTLPKLERELPILLGTEEEQLSRGVGHYTGSKLPGEAGQIILSGHRDTVFKGIGTLQSGDQIDVETEFGLFSYNIVHSYIVDADDTTVIDFSIDEEVLLLTTCYPFNYVGNAPQRYVIEAKPNMTVNN